MKDNWPRSFDLLMEHEGGFVNNPHDNGGATKYGVTIGTLRDWRRRTNPKAVVTAQMVRDLRLEEARDIAKVLYWDKVGGDILPRGIDYALFDWAYHAGPDRPARALQRILRVTVDGRIGNITARAAAASDKAKVIAMLGVMRLEHLMGHSDWKVFGKGWKRRVLEVTAEAVSQSCTPCAPESAVAR
jgi:lysozyme family protein